MRNYHLNNKLLVNQMPSSIQLTKCKFVVVLVVENVHQISVERMNVLKYV